MGCLGRLHRCFDKSVPLISDQVQSIECSLDNGGPAGVLYELLVACFYYGLIAASLAEVRLTLSLSLTSE